MVSGFQRGCLAVVAGIAALFTAGTAAAGDLDYPITTWSEGYQELGNPTTLADTKAQPYASTYFVPLPGDFTVRYWGQNYTGTTVYVMGDGSIQLSYPAYVYYYYNYSFPYQCQSYVYPDGYITAPGLCGEPFIAPWWDEWMRNSNSPYAGGITYEIDGTAPHRVLKVQWKNFTNYACNDSNTTPPCNYAKSYSFQAWIYESPDGVEKSLIQFRYATPLDGADPNVAGGDETGYSYYPTMSGTVGVQSPDETMASSLSCSPTCTLTNWPSDQVVMFGESDKAELIMSPAATAISGSKGNANINLTGGSTLRNLGNTRATNVYYSFYYTQNTALDTTKDTLIGESPNGYTLETLGSVDANNKPSDRAVATDPFTFARPADGFYRLCGFIDDRKTVTEAIEDNNTPCARTTFGIGVDMGGAILSLPQNAGPNDDMPVHLRVVDNGTDDTGPFTWQVYMSAKTKLDATAKLIYTGHFDNLTNAGPYDTTQHIQLPKDVVGNNENSVDRYVILSIDPDNTVAELDETNNTIVSKSTVKIIKPDLRLDMASVGGLDKGCYFGNPISATFTLFNDGAARARDYQNAIVLSDNAVITAFDQAFVLAPPSCTMDADCTGTLGDGATCSPDLGSCVKPCTTDDDCVDASMTNIGLTCFAPPDGSPNYCNNVLTGYSSTILTINGTIPSTDQNGADLPDGQWFFGAVADFTDQVAEGNEGNNTKVLGQFLCQKPAPDFVASLLETADTGAAGEVLAVHRILENLGTVGGSTSWSYYLSSNPIISSQDIQLQLANMATANATLDPQGSNDGTDLVVLPSYLAEGSYYLGIVVNPADASGNHPTHELTYDNNTTLALAQINVHAAKLHIVTSSLPPAVVGVPYMQQLIAVGGSGDYIWSTPNPDELPKDLSVTADGLLTGTATDKVNTYAFHVTVTSGSISAEGLMVISVTPTTGPLTITSDVLPPGYADVKYLVDLVAQGGNPPYTWAVENHLPTGLNLKNNIISGTPTEPDGMNTPLKPRFRVTDSRGQWAEADFILPILTRADLSVQTPHLVDALVGSDYLQIVRGAGGQPPYIFTITGLPSGLSSVAKPPTAAEIKGAPLTAGQYDITVSIEDALHQHASQVYRFAVIGQPIKIRTTGPLPDAARGKAYEVTLTSNATTAIWSMFAGVLPDGITLDAHTGVLSGTVAQTAGYREYPFVVKVDDGHGGEGFASYSINLPAPTIHLPDNIVKTGCGNSASGGSPTMLALMIGAALLFRRRNS